MYRGEIMVKLNKSDYKRLEDMANRTVTCQPFVDDNAEKKIKRIKQVKGDGWKAFEFFSKTYFSHVVQLEFSSVHRMMFNIVNGSVGITGITGFRGLGKSAIFGFIYPVWRIIKGEKYVIYGAATIEQSSEKSEFIAYEFESNKRLIFDFPELRIADRTENGFFLANNTRIRATSINQELRGTINSRAMKRPGLIVLDDIDEESNIGNMNIGKRKMEKIIHNIKMTLDPAGDGRVLWLGNLTHPNIAICQFKKKILDEIGADHDKVKDDLLCLYGDEKRLIQIPLEKNGKSTWEAQYSTARIAVLKKELGHVGFLREMQGKSIIDGTIFKADWFIGGKIPPDKEIKNVWLYIDPAWGKKGCFKSIFAVGFNGYNYYVLKAWCRQCENSKMFEYLYNIFVELKSRFGSRVQFSYEANYGQTRIMSDFDDWCVATNKVAISHHFKKVFNTENKNLRIEALEPVIESGKIVFPEGQDMPIIIGQFTSYPQGYIDGCDALAGCMERFNTYGRKRGIKIHGLKY